MIRSWLISIGAIAAWISCAAGIGRCAERGAGAVSFSKVIVPLLVQRCFACHEGRDPESGQRLDLRSELLGESSGTPLVVPGQSAKSRLVELISGSDPDLVMPPQGPRLSTDEIDLIKRWIDGGLAWDSAILPERDEADRHWSFQPVRRPAVPMSAERDGWSLGPVDRFIAARHAEHGLAPAAPASRRQLARRVYLDLWGLPPSWDQVQAFVADDRPDAYERLVDRLLAAPQYGERWARHWLDLARWAESEGYESNHPRPFAWRYRDYVIRAFAADQPYDQFLRQQIAGDELPEYSDENLIATGFLAAARLSSNEEDKWLQRNDVTVDVVNAFGSAVLGLTLGCAQCHNHKFDPVSTRDYYRLHAFFARGMPVNVRLRDAALAADYEVRRAPEYEPALALKDALYEKARRQAVAAERKRLAPEELAVIDIPSSRRTPDEELAARRVSQRFVKGTGEIERQLNAADRKLYDELKKRIAELEKNAPAPPQTFAFLSPVASPHRLEVLPSIGFYPLPYDPQELAALKTYVMPRGQVHAIGPEVSPGWPVVLDRQDQRATSAELTRRDLADWLTSRDNPIVARVWVNRLWHHHFGRGLVATPDDFGVRGAAPSHSELLDWLAAELMDRGWRTKHLHRVMVAATVPNGRENDQ